MITVAAETAAGRDLGTITALAARDLATTTHELGLSTLGAAETKTEEVQPTFPSLHDLAKVVVHLMRGTALDGAAETPYWQQQNVHPPMLAAGNKTASAAYQCLAMTCVVAQLKLAWWQRFLWKRRRLSEALYHLRNMLVRCLGQCPMESSRQN